ncbi:3',5'-cyclic-AMP phosphodiesterase [Marinimicrobium sp. C6131]|uniref:3',5'-cyclic-AMP phosphodiesterase n=1 Tax=Marinimicrobium sp. C6131 TaxID=3022676 RepID=UPI00223DDC38|nr:3',5'-cyclic-AMP phosphodiesterase [Marinimicrobium sp. C6131]UZJ43182.1 3',5'-cyclic-AMP phosphodiesterase [Marinimicrobium sp. C6131]
MRLIQITDCHLGPLSDPSLLGLNTDQSLDDVLRLVAREQTSVDAMVCTGDIASDAHEECYGRFVTTVRNHFSVPLGWLPGNHDSAAIMAQLESEFVPESRVMSVGEWLVVLLDSAVPGQVYGHLADSELDFLSQTLASNSPRPTLVMLHHQPVPVGSRWIDEYILKNADDFFAIIDAHPQVKGVSWGHVHQFYHGERNGVQLFATPATCIQFKPGSESFAVDRAMPGYRWFDLHDDGRLDTGVSRVEDQKYQIDYQSAGY